jgi:putative autotransporter adhesin-like protein
MRPSWDRGALRWPVWAGQAVAIMATGGLLAGCLGTTTGDTNQGAAGGASGGSYSYSGSDAVEGSGKLTSRTVDLPGVTSVVAGADFVVNLKIGSPAQATVTMDDNVAERIEASVTGHELRLGIKPGMSVRNATLRAEVTMSQLDRLAANGASHVTLASPVTGAALQLSVAGASQVTGPVAVTHLETFESGACVLTLSGRVSSLHLGSAGTSQLLGADLAVADLDAVLSGASQATVTVSDTLAATAEGASVLRYHGIPNITRQETTGVSSITPASP